jgi:hypothetical protein
VGATEGEFPRHAFSDGGIYDNLGLRMFRYLHGLDLLPEEPNSQRQSVASNRLERVFVSDAGATFKVRSDSRAGGPAADGASVHGHLDG